MKVVVFPQGGDSNILSFVFCLLI